MDPIQALVDGMNAASMRERAQTQMTLGGLIEALEAMPPDAMVRGLCDAHSYRGYYSDLAFETQADPITVADALALCRGAMGKVFEGYKGGDFVMGAPTPVWLADYGCCGKKIMALHPDGSLATADDEY